MKDIPVSQVRNVALLGHTGSGKTTIVDAILHKLKIADRMGSTADGTSFADWNDEEKERNISMSAKPFTAAYESGGKKFGLVLLDTPGYADFFGQILAATAVADAGLLAIDASSGIQVGTNRAWRRCEQLGLPRGVVITGIDKENADFQGTLSAVQEIWGNKCVPVVIPTLGGSAVVDVLGSGDVPADVADQVETIKSNLIESAAESDDVLIEKYLGGEALSAEEIAGGLRDAVRQGTTVPVFATNATADTGIQELLDGIARLFPSPEQREVKDAEGEAVEIDSNGSLAGLVWRSLNDPYVGQLTFVRVFSGNLKADSEIYNATQGQKERVGALYVINGKEQENVDQAGPGDIVALTKLKSTVLNDTLTQIGKDIKLPVIEFPRPVMAYSIVPKTKGDEDKLANALSRVSDEDATITVERNNETKEMIIAGMGDIQMDIAVSRIKKRGNVEVNLNTPKVAYKETINGTGEGHYKHKKQSGGRGQYGEVYIRVEPNAAGGDEWFVNAIVGGAIPSGFIPAVQKGLVEGMVRGSVAGYPVINAKVTVYDGSYHDVDSSEIAFKIAGARAFREGMSNARPVLLEPIMKLRVILPEQFMGDVTGDLNHKRGRILGMGNEDGLQVIEAEVPQAEMFKYSSELRSMTSGQGTFEMDFDRYDVVPANVAQKVVDEAGKVKDDDD